MNSTPTAIHFRCASLYITMFKLFSIFLLTLITILTNAQNLDRFSISGKIVSENSGKPIVAGFIFIDKNNGTISDTEGRFLLSGIKKGKYKLSLRCADFGEKDTLIIIEKQNIKDIFLTVPADCKSFNEQKATKDLKKGNAILFVNSTRAESDQTANNHFKEKYGISFEFNDFGLPAEDCMIIYNQTIFANLDIKFGKEWRNDIKVNAVGLK